LNQEVNNEAEDTKIPSSIIQIFSRKIRFWL